MVTETLLVYFFIRVYQGLSVLTAFHFKVGTEIAPLLGEHRIDENHFTKN